MIIVRPLGAQFGYLVAKSAPEPSRVELHYGGLEGAGTVPPPPPAASPFRAIDERRATRPMATTSDVIESLSIGLIGLSAGGARFCHRARPL